MMDWRKSVRLLALVGLVAIAVAGCGEGGEPAADSQQPDRPLGWTDETHSNDAEPNYDAVFPEDKVNQIRITITPEDWDRMQADMTSLLGPPGTGQPGGLPAAPGAPAEELSGVPGGDAPDAPGIPRWIDITQNNPVWVPATIEFNGLTWTQVGVRYKGNSSLRSGWNSGSDKLPFKLDFDEFEDEYPEIENQRFYGFKQLSLSTAFNDATYMRDVIAADILAEAGLVAAETAYYEVILNYGAGPVNLGLYIVIEVIDDTVIDRFFADSSGNIYEGDGPAVSLALGTYNRIRDSFLKENNQGEADWSDIEALFKVLHAAKRTIDPGAWRASLESLFDVDAFLEWLAICAVTQHWDTYGQMSHNFYLYNDPDSGQLVWISWDHNEILKAGEGMVRPGGVKAPGPGIKRSVSLSRDDVGEGWPLIRYLLDDPVYHERYLNYLEETINGAFIPEQLEARCRALAAMIAPYVTEGSSSADFASAVQGLIDRIYERYRAAAVFLAGGDG